MTDDWPSSHGGSTDKTKQDAARNSFCDGGTRQEADRGSSSISADEMRQGVEDVLALSTRKNLDSQQSTWSSPLMTGAAEAQDTQQSTQPPPPTTMAALQAFCC